MYLAAANSFQLAASSLFATIVVEAAAALVVAAAARTPASVPSLVASTPLATLCAVLAAVSRLITPITVCIPLYRAIKPSIIPQTILQASPLPFSASVILSMPPFMPLTALQEVVNAL